MPFYTASDNVSIYYNDTNAGLPVIALPGVARNGLDFQHVTPHLRDVRLIRPDYRGRGKSDWADPETYTMDKEADDVLELMDHLNIERAALIGSSHGGVLAMKIARKARHRVLGIALNDMGPVSCRRGLASVPAFLGKQPKEKTYEEVADLRARTWTTYKNVPMSRWLAEVRAQYVETDDGLKVRYDPKLRRTVLKSGILKVPHFWEDFEATRDMPLALVCAENSDFLKSECVEEMYKRRPHLRSALVKDRGHIPFLDEEPALSLLKSWNGDLRQTAH